MEERLLLLLDMETIEVGDTDPLTDVLPFRFLPDSNWLRSALTDGKNFLLEIGDSGSRIGAPFWFQFLMSTLKLKYVNISKYKTKIIN